MAEGTAVLRRNRPGTKAKVRVYPKGLFIVPLKKPRRVCEHCCLSRVVFYPSVYVDNPSLEDGPDLEMLS